MLIFISRLLDMYAHVSVSAREGNNRLDYPFVNNTRPMRVLAYRKEPFMSCEHGRVQLMEDFDITLQLFLKGYENAVISEYAHDQAGTQAAGGCSDYRTKEMHEKNVRKIVKMYSGLAKLREKHNKTGGEFGHRMEATIYWKKALAQGQEKWL